MIKSKTIESMSTNCSNIVAYLEDLMGDYTVKPQGNAAMLLQ